MDALAEFWKKLHAEWLPMFCVARGYSVDSFSDTKTISEKDAADFLRAMSFITVNARGQFTMPRSKAKVVIFWDGRFSDSRIRMSLWVEPIIAIGAIARLHLDYGWPIDCLGMESSKWEFDLMAFLPGAFENEHIAGEVKASRKELDALMGGLNVCCSRGTHDCNGERAMQVNAHKKWSGLVRSKAPIFWALGPDNDSRVFRVTHADDGTMNLTHGSIHDLRFPRTPLPIGDQPTTLEP